MKRKTEPAEDSFDVDNRSIKVKHPKKCKYIVDCKQQHSLENKVFAHVNTRDYKHVFGVDCVCVLNTWDFKRSISRLHWIRQICSSPV